jgi:hypothetical protein
LPDGRFVGQGDSVLADELKRGVRAEDVEEPLVVDVEGFGQHRLARRARENEGLQSRGRGESSGQARDSCRGETARTVVAFLTDAGWTVSRALKARWSTTCASDGMALVFKPPAPSLLRRSSVVCSRGAAGRGQSELPSTEEPEEGTHGRAGCGGAGQDGQGEGEGDHGDGSTTGWGDDGGWELAEREVANVGRRPPYNVDTLSFGPSLARLALQANVPELTETQSRARPLARSCRPSRRGPGLVELAATSRTESDDRRQPRTRQTLDPERRWPSLAAVAPASWPSGTLAVIEPSCRPAMRPAQLGPSYRR